MEPDNQNSPLPPIMSETSTVAPKKHNWIIITIIVLVILMVGITAFNEFRRLSQPRDYSAELPIVIALNHNPDTIASSTQPATVLTSSVATSNWKIYTNTDFGFNIKYPTSFYLSPIQVPASSIQSFGGWTDLANITFSSKNKGFISIDVYTNTKGSSLEQWKNWTRATSAQDGSLSDVVIGNRDFVKYRYSAFGAENKFVTYATQLDSTHVITIGAQIPFGESDEFIGTLMTLKF